MNYQKHNLKKKKLNLHHQPQSVGTQLVENYSLDSPILKLEYGNHKDTKIEKKIEKNIIYIFIFINYYTYNL